MKKRIWALLLSGILAAVPTVGTFAGETEMVTESAQETVPEETADQEISAEENDASEAEDLALVARVEDELRNTFGLEAKAYAHDGYVTFIDGACTDQKISSMEDASALVANITPMINGDERVQFVPWREVTDPSGNHYFIFQQMYDDTTVLGGAIKVITDPEGNMTALSSSVETEIPEEDEVANISAEEAEQLVLKYGSETMQMDLRLIEGQTVKMILPLARSLGDADEEVDDRSAFVWAVYTDNPVSRIDLSLDLPYLAHYVTVEGEYLYNKPTIMPGDEAGNAGFDASYVFEFMEPADYTGYVDLADGTEKEISVTVMRDKRTGMYYLGNIERRIVVADCYEMLYNNDQVVLESSPDNMEWDQVGLLSLYNYCRAWDYYNAIGWTGGDGLSTPILILNNYCDENHVPVNNACYVGHLLGWQLFLASQANDLSQCLDVLAHEFTHCVTSSVTTYNAYFNDYGAINEAMSDIQGKTCQMMMEEDATWILGDKSSSPVRSISTPHLFAQPEYSWDYYYQANVKTPTDINDRGGVHTNSSLLNYLAYLLYEKGGMTFEEGRAFWFTVDCAMVPRTDYKQLSELLPWALKASGLGKYEETLLSAIETVRLGDNSIPETLNDDQVLLTLSLPDNEIFNDGNWALELVLINTEKLISNTAYIGMQLQMGNYDILPESLAEMIKEGKEAEAEKAEEEKKEEKGVIEGFFDTLVEILDDSQEEPETEQIPEESGLSEEMKEELGEWINQYYGGTVLMDSSSAGQDGHTIRMIGIPGRTIPVLFHMVPNEGGTQLEQMVYAVYFNKKWYNTTSFMAFEQDAGEEVESVVDRLTNDQSLQEIFGELKESFSQITSFSDIADLLTFKVEAGQTMEIPSTGLEKLTIPEDAPSFVLSPDQVDAAPKKSRPKLEGETEAVTEAFEAETEIDEAA